MSCDRAASIFRKESGRGDLLARLAAHFQFDMPLCFREVMSVIRTCFIVLLCYAMMFYCDFNLHVSGFLPHPDTKL